MWGEGGERKDEETEKGLVSRRHKSCISKWCRGTELNCPHGDFQSINGHNMSALRRTIARKIKLFYPVYRT